MDFKPSTGLTNGICSPQALKGLIQNPKSKINGKKDW